MSPGHRDRHARGLRGPLALPNPYTRRAVSPPRPSSRSDFFTEAVNGAVDRIQARTPEVLTGVTFGIEDVPYLNTAWSGDRVPLAAAVEGDEEKLSQVVVYRRPIEHRAPTRRALRVLVYRTIVEQLAALTGWPVERIDPDGADEEG